MKVKRDQVRLSDVIKICKEYECSMAQALNILRQGRLCQNCLKLGMVEFNNGSIVTCLFCDYTIEIGR